MPVFSFIRQSILSFFGDFLNTFDETYFSKWPTEVFIFKTKICKVNSDKDRTWIFHFFQNYHPCELLIRGWWFFFDFKCKLSSPYNFWKIRMILYRIWNDSIDFSTIFVMFYKFFNSFDNIFSNVKVFLNFSIHQNYCFVIFMIFINFFNFFEGLLV